MTKYHKAASGHFQRCKATVRKGQNVSGCPLEVDGVTITHTVGLEGIAATGGGTIRKWIAEDTYRDTKVMQLDEHSFMTSTGKLERVYSMSGKLMPLRERLRALKNMPVPQSAENVAFFEATVIMGESEDQALLLTMGEHGLDPSLLAHYFSETNSPVTDIPGHEELLETFVNAWEHVAEDDFMMDTKEGSREYLRDMWREQFQGVQGLSEVLEKCFRAGDALIALLLDHYQKSFDQWVRNTNGSVARKS